MFLFSAVAIPALATPGPVTDELERNRRLLETWRADPEHYARLRRDLKAFCDLPEEDRDRLRRLDHELNETDARTQTRLLSVLGRYVAWLERLPETDRQQIASADRTERIKVIRAIRDERYLQSLPLKAREELSQLPAGELHNQLKRLRQEDRQLRLACLQLATQRPEQPPKPTPATTVVMQPTQLKDFPADVRFYVDNVLWRQISGEEAEQIKKAEGAPWPLLARAIQELSNKHPVKLPGPVNGPRRFFELPADVLKSMPAKDLQQAQKKRLNELVGRWPDFAAEYSVIARKNGVTLPRQLGPCHPKQFEAPVAQFIDRTLIPKLSTQEKDELKSAEGHWPDYPRLLLELSKKHGLEVPLMRLPGAREMWDQARAP